MGVWEEVGNQIYRAADKGAVTQCSLDFFMMEI